MKATQEAAAKAYDVFAADVQGEFFRPNFPENE